MLKRLSCWWNGHRWRHVEEDVYLNRIRCEHCDEWFSLGRRWDSFPARRF
jgi:hypothetical protein